MSRLRLGFPHAPFENFGCFYWCLRDEKGFMSHPERSNKAESRDLDRGKKAEGAL